MHLVGFIKRIQLCFLSAQNRWLQNFLNESVQYFSPDSRYVLSPLTTATVISKFGCHTQATDCSTDIGVRSRPRTHFTEPTTLKCTLQSFDTLHSSLQTTALWNNLALLYNIGWAKIARAPVEKGRCSGLEVGGPINKTLYVAYVTFPTHYNSQYCTFYAICTVT